MYSNNPKHSYLRSNISGFKSFSPTIVNRIVDKQMGAFTTYRNLEPPFLKLTSSNPIFFAPNVDGTRSKIAFGRWALPKLKKEIHHDSIYVVMQALNSINDLVHDPEKAFEALRIGLVDRLEDMMLHEKDYVREKICMILTTIAGLEAGKRAIMRRYKILHNLALLIEDKVDVVRYKAQQVVERVAFSPVGANALNVADFAILLLRMVGGTPKTENEDVLISHLATLKHLLERDIKMMALKHKAMDIFVEKLNSENEEVVKLSLECIALLCQIPEGRELAEEINLSYILCKKLFDKSLPIKIKATGTLAFTTIHSRSRNEISKMCTVKNVIEVLQYFHDSEGQMMATKVLSNLSEDPQGKPLVNHFKGKIKELFTNNDQEVDRHKKFLLNLLKRNSKKTNKNN